MLVAWSKGDSTALDRLMPVVSAELHRLAKRYMRREMPGHTLQTTALVNEAYLKLVDSSRVAWQNRAHFFALSARVMRHILVDFARTNRSLRKGGPERPVNLDDADGIFTRPGRELIELDEALRTLEQLDPRQSQIVELRFFGGLSVEETAEALRVSEGTVRRDWTLARAWLRQELTRGAK
jgi:RNA polymerase sigma-70 factor, ECF subfamily